MRYLALLLERPGEEIHALDQAAHPALGRHLARSVETGLFCAYRPERAVRWRVVAPGGGSVPQAGTP